MSTKQTSRMTLADVLVQISEANLPPKVKADMSSALRKVAATLGSNPGLIPVDPANLRRRLEGISALTVMGRPGGGDDPQFQPARSVAADATLF